MQNYELAWLCFAIVLLWALWNLSSTFHLKQKLNDESDYIFRLRAQLTGAGLIPVERPNGNWQLPK